MNKYIVMVSRANMPTSCWGAFRYYRIAVVQTNGINKPKQINSRHKSVISIVKTWEKLYKGYTLKSAFYKALHEAHELANSLNINEEENE